MGSIDFKVTGKGELITKFNNLSKEMQKESKRIVTKYTFEMEKKAKNIASEKDVYDTGHLIRNIRGTLYNGGLSGEVTAHANYSIYHELGTRYFPARPFIYPAFVLTRKGFIEEMQQKVKELEL